MEYAHIWANDVIWPELAYSKRRLSNVSDLPCGSYCGPFFWLVSVKAGVMKCVYAHCGWFRTIQSCQRVRLPNMLAFRTGSAFYVLAALVEKGLLKLGNFKKSSSKRRYAYILTPKGVREKSLLTSRFIERKREEYKDLRAEIEALEREAGLTDGNGYLPDSRPWNCAIKDCNSIYGVYHQKMRFLSGLGLPIMRRYGE